ncbi:protein-L-isoaspartate O-methyltransferase [Streptacidiphilus sp. MAP12-33]|uniref:hypothetical protein n=1 Tax=Streptacidiphilus sp. MAP12-33 TaxID=3156266 RepID=UPI0035116BAC
MSPAYDDQRLADSYAHGNDMPEASLRAWVDLIASYQERPSPAVIEVGARTGMFSAAMTRWIAGARVLAVDPADRPLPVSERYDVAVFSRR